MNPPKASGTKSCKVCEDASTHEKILEAARAEFIEKGLGGARMQEIADRAGINKALLHYHFRDKEGLHQAALKSVIETVTGRILSAQPDAGIPDSPEEAIRQIVRTYMRVLRENPQMVGLVLRELADGGENLEGILEAVAPMAQRLYRTVLEQVRNKADDWPSIDPVHAFMSLFSMVWGVFLLKPIYSRVLPAAGIRQTFDDAFLDERTDAIADMVIAATLPRRTA
jgi:AcrR family transcriptional regulator